jgi:hypothetical protein
MRARRKASAGNLSGNGFSVYIDADESDDDAPSHREMSLPAH